MSLISEMIPLAPGMVVDIGLRSVLMWAIVAWGISPTRPLVVRWGKPGECDGYGGGKYMYGTGEIILDPEFDLTKNGETPNGLLLTMEHEYGHYLGLDDKLNGEDSIMKSSWDPPYVQGPTPLDFEELSELGLIPVVQK
jgi:hypothetical protein